MDVEEEGDGGRAQAVSGPRTNLRQQETQVFGNGVRLSGAQESVLTELLARPTA